MLFEVRQTWMLILVQPAPEPSVEWLSAHLYHLHLRTCFMEVLADRTPRTVHGGFGLKAIGLGVARI